MHTGIYKKIIKENRALIVESFMQEAETEREFVDTWLENVQSELEDLLVAVRKINEDVVDITGNLKQDLAKKANDFYEVSQDRLEGKIVDFANALNLRAKPNPVAMQKELNERVVVYAAKIVALCEELKEEAYNLRARFLTANADELLDDHVLVFISKVADADIDKIVLNLKKGIVPFL